MTVRHACRSIRILRARDADSVSAEHSSTITLACRLVCSHFATTPEDADVSIRGWTFGLAVGLSALVVTSSGSAKTAGQGRSDSQHVHLRDVAEAAGVTFVYERSPTPDKHYVESAPGGLAVFDYNGDGRA